MPPNLPCVRSGGYSVAMGRDREVVRGGTADENPPTPRFGWRPEAEVTPPPASAYRDAVRTQPATNGRSPYPYTGNSAPPATNGHHDPQAGTHHNGHSWSRVSGSGQRLGTAMPTVAEPFAPTDTIPYLTPVPRDAREHRPRRAADAGRRRGVLRSGMHLLLLAIVVAVVVGHGYWNTSAQVVQPGGIDRIGDLRQVPPPSAQSVSNGVGALTLATAGSSSLTGYVSQFASAVVPAQLDLQTVTAKDGDTIADIADRTGRGIDTLLWANGLADPAKLLPPGTEIRVPPVDGMLHVVHDGDTLESIAARYQVDVGAITGYAPNNVQSSADLVPYRMIMVPGGKMPTRDRVVTYTVREGDTLATIAQFFGLHPSTIVWANSLPNGDLIFPGQNLAILPTDGVMVTVTAGESVESLAQRFGVEPKAILNYPANGLGAGGKLRVGQQVMIPGGQPPAPPPPPPPAEPAPQSQPAPQTAASQPAPAPGAGGAATGRFIWPTSGVITQYFGPTSFALEPPYAGYAHFHQGLDIANGFGTPIVAADGGTVIYAGWSSSGLGNAVAIDHGNGLITWYGHMGSRPAVSVGQRVSRGQYLGPMGSTGASTGSHVHFAMLKNGVYVDPLSYLR